MKFILRFVTWTGVWAIGAPLIIRFRDDLPGIGGILVIQTIIALASIVAVWKALARRQPGGAEVALMSWPAHGRKAVTFWNNAGGYFRMGLFVLCCLALFVAAEVFPSKWVGMFSALPLPGLFAIAMLSIVSTPDDYKPMRDHRTARRAQRERFQLAVRASVRPAAVRRHSAYRGGNHHAGRHDGHRRRATVLVDASDFGCPGPHQGIRYGA
jgi:hypothetical protein